MQLGNIFNAVSMANNPDMIFQNMLRTNPQFKKFVNDNKGKSAEQIAQENGIDYNTLLSLIKR